MRSFVLLLMGATTCSPFELSPSWRLKKYLQGRAEEIGYDYANRGEFHVHTTLHKFAATKVDELGWKVYTQVKLAYEYVNPSFAWNPLKFGNLTKIQLDWSLKQLKAPRFVGCFFTINTTETLRSCTISYNGQVVIVVDVFTDQRCEMEFESMPYDSHNCTACLHLDKGHGYEPAFDIAYDEDFYTAYLPHSYDPIEIAREYKRMRIDTWNYWEDHKPEKVEWSVSNNVTAEVSVVRGMSQVNMNYTITRNPAFYNWELVYFTLCVVGGVIGMQYLHEEHKPCILVLGIGAIFVAVRVTGEYHFQRNMMILLCSSISFLFVFTIISMKSDDLKRERNAEYRKFRDD